MRDILLTRALTLKKTCAGIFIVLMLVGSGTLAVPKKADAVLGGLLGGGSIVLDPSNLIKNTITAAEQGLASGLMQSLNLKEFTLDGIAWSLAKKVLGQTVASVVDWVNSGFNGKPAFITDYDQYYLDAQDRAANDFIDQSNFTQLCQPLQTPVRFIVDRVYREARDYRERSQCTFSDSNGSLDAFISGDFKSGGWSAWFSLVSNPQNNIYGAAAISINAAQSSVENAKDIAKTEAQNGQGFLSDKRCEKNGKCTIVTPGSVIGHYLDFSLTVGDRVLIQSDQINEVIGSLFSKLGSQALTGSNGLLGLSYSQGGASPSYVSQFSNETATFGATADARFLTDAITLQTQYQNVFAKAANDLDSMLASFGTTTTTTGSTTQISGNFCSELVPIVKDALTLQNKYDGETSTTQSIIDILNLLLESFNQSSDANIKTVVVQQFQKLQGDGTLHTTSEITERTFSVASEVTALKSRAATATSSPSCN